MAISAEFQADFSQFTAAVREATSDLATFEGQTKQIDASLADLAYKAGQGILSFGKEIAATANIFVSSYAEEEAATQRLASALQGQGLATTAVIDGYAAMATQFQSTTKYSDDAVTSAQAVLTTIGRLGPEDMQPAITAATNLASALKVDLSTAANMLAKAIGSGGESLGKLAPLLADVNVKGMSTSEMLEVISSKTGPAAANELKTVAGQTAYLANQMDDARGKIGSIVADALLPMLEAFSALPGPLQTVIAGGIALGTALAPLAITFASLIPMLTTLAPLIGTALVGAFQALLPFLGPAGWIALGVIAIYAAFKNWDAIVGIVQNVYTAIKTWMVDKFNAVVDLIMAPINRVVGAFEWLGNKLVFHSIVPDMMSAIGDNFAQLNELMVQPAAAATDKVTQSFAAMGSAVGKATAMAGQGLGGSTAGMAPSWSQSLVPRYGAGGYLGTGAPISITINGSVLGNKDEIARVVGDAVTSSYRSGGNRLPV